MRMSGLLAGVGVVLVLAGAFLIFASIPVRLPSPTGTLGVAKRALQPVFDDPGVPTPVAELWYPTGGSAPWPVLIYLPSWTGTKIEDVALIQDLVSHGFAVVGLRYPTASDLVQGKQAGVALRAEVSGDMAFSSAEAFEKTQALGAEKVRARARNVAMLLDYLAGLDGQPNGEFAHRLDLGRVGVWGFSLGGAAAAQAAWLDRRIKAAANLDGWLFGDAAVEGVPCPYLLIGDDSPLPGPADLTASDPNRRYTAMFDAADYARQVAGLSRYGGFLVTIDGTTHLNFTDAAARSRFGRLHGAGSANPRRALAITGAYLTGFFSTYLLDRPSPLLVKGAVPYPEAHLKVFGHGDARA